MNTGHFCDNVWSNTILIFALSHSGEIHFLAVAKGRVCVLRETHCFNEKVHLIAFRSVTETGGKFKVCSISKINSPPLSPGEGGGGRWHTVDAKISFLFLEFTVIEDPLFEA